jgi:hypothetical protein
MTTIALTTTTTTEGVEKHKKGEGCSGFKHKTSKDQREKERHNKFILVSLTNRE